MNSFVRSMPASKRSVESLTVRPRRASSLPGASEGGLGENVDLRRVLLNGRRKPLHQRARQLAALTSGDASGRRRLYGRTVLSAAGRTVEVWDEETGQPRSMLMFGSNNYLGLATHPHVLEAVRTTTASWGVGLGGPPLLNGTTHLHRTLEERLAALKGQESAALFSSGYGANVGLAAGLMQAGDQVFYDAESHASLCDGLRLAGLSGRRFRHNDLDHLEELLATRPPAQGDTFVAVEGVYSMRGDLAPLGAVVAQCRRHEALLVVDDAHGLGVMGPHGRGTAAHFGVEEGVDLAMGTFSKAFSVTGGFVAAARPLIEYLRFFSRPYVFSAALPPVTLAAVHAGLDVLEREPERVERLRENVGYAADCLRALGFDLAPEAAIIALQAPAGMDVQAAGAHFHQMGLFVNAVEFPAVPCDQQLFRISVMATHERRDLDRLVAGVEEVWHHHAPA